MYSITKQKKIGSQIGQGYIPKKANHMDRDLCFLLCVLLHINGNPAQSRSCKIDA